MTDILKPCPFCGGEALLHEFRTYVSDRHRMETKYYIECRKCGVEQRNYISDKEAANDWNRRASDAGTSFKAARELCGCGSQR